MGKSFNCLDAIYDGSGKYDELLEVDSKEFERDEAALVDSFMAEHDKEFEEARWGEVRDRCVVMGTKARKMSAKGSLLHRAVAEKYRHGSRDPADFSVEFYDLVVKGHDAVRKRLGWPCSFA